MLNLYLGLNIAVHFLDLFLSIVYLMFHQMRNVRITAHSGHEKNARKLVIGGA